MDTSPAFEEQGAPPVKGHPLIKRRPKCPILSSSHRSTFGAQDTGNLHKKAGADEKQVAWSPLKSLLFDGFEHVLRLRLGCRNKDYTETTKTPTTIQIAATETLHLFPTLCGSPITI